MPVCASTGKWWCRRGRMALRRVAALALLAAAAARPAVGRALLRTEARHLARLSGGGDWAAYLTEEGRTYWFNHATGVSSWEPPAEAVQQEIPASDWSAHRTETGEMYYYNFRTGETTWEPPAGVAVSADCAPGSQTGGDPWASQMMDDSRLATGPAWDTTSPSETLSTEDANRNKMDDAFAQSNLHVSSSETSYSQATATESDAADASSPVPMTQAAMAAVVTEPLQSEEGVGTESNTQQEGLSEDQAREGISDKEETSRTVETVSSTEETNGEEEEEEEKDGEYESARDGFTSLLLARRGDLAANTSLKLPPLGANTKLVGWSAAAPREKTKKKRGWCWWLACCLPWGWRAEEEASMETLQKSLPTASAAAGDDLLGDPPSASDSVTQAHGEALQAAEAAQRESAETLRRLRARLEAVEAEATQRAAMLAAREGETQRLEEELSRMHQECERLKLSAALAEQGSSDLQAAREETAEHRRRCIELTEEVRLAREAGAQLEEQVAAARARAEAANEQHAQLEALVERLQRERVEVAEEMKQRVAEARGEEQEHAKGSTEALQVRVAELEGRATQAEAAAAAAAMRENQMVTEISRLQEEIETVRRQEAGAVAALKEELAARERALAEAEVSRSKLEEEVGLAKGRWSEAQTLAQDLKSQLLGLEAKDVEAKSAAALLESQLEERTRVAMEQEERVMQLKHAVEDATHALSDEVEARRETEQERNELKMQLEEANRRLEVCQSEAAVAADSVKLIRKELDMALVRAEDAQQANERTLRHIGERWRHMDRHSTDILRSVVRLQAAGLRRYTGAYFNRQHRSTVATASFRCMSELVALLCQQMAEHALGESAPGNDKASAGMRAGIDALTVTANSWSAVNQLVLAQPPDWRLPSKCAESLVRACEIHLLLLKNLPDASEPASIDGQTAEEVDRSLNLLSTNLQQTLDEAIRCLN